MTRPAFLIVGGRSAVIANDVHDFRYRATVLELAPGMLTQPRCNTIAETQILVEDGTVEIMIGGAAGFVLAGDFVRVPPGVSYACRNAGEMPARLLCRTASPRGVQRALQVTANFAA